ncbi:sister chromatid cohesion protein DCC1 [Petromyzon marinus]|uniref:sister chromatid cohesion protein DCC1 n=1 Tax=Petromyzon marinus TaxID=7757 RepID=UPI003F706245
MCAPPRSLSEVLATLEVARLDEAELLPVPQSLSFAPRDDGGRRRRRGGGGGGGDGRGGEGDEEGEEEEDAIVILETDETLSGELRAGHSLVIRGDGEDHAVLCTGDATYELRAADTSNLLLLLPDARTADSLWAEGHAEAPRLLTAHVFGFANSYLEVRRCRPRLKKLRSLLGECPFSGPENEAQYEGQQKYTTADLLDRVQASEVELQAGLKALNACQIDGRWRMLDLDYEMRLLSLLTQLVDSESWSFRHVPLRVCLDELGVLEPRDMIEHCLNCYGEWTDEEEGGAAEVVYSLHEDRVCRALAVMLLKGCVKFNLAEFCDVWRQSVPEGMDAQLGQLQGVALVERAARPEVISLLRVEDLPDDPQERFSKLFSLRDKWTEEDIAPYVRDLCAEKQSVSALLTKHARSSMHNGVKVFNSRRSVS